MLHMFYTEDNRNRFLGSSHLQVYKCQSWLLPSVWPWGSARHCISMLVLCSLLIVLLHLNTTCNYCSCIFIVMFLLLTLL